MSDSRQLATATALLIPFLIATMVVVSIAASTFSSMPLFLAGVYLSVLGVILYFVVPVGVFLLLVHVARRRANRPGWVSFLLFMAVVAASFSWFLMSWSYGNRYQGYFTTVLLAWLNGISVLALLGTLIHAIRQATFRANVVAHWCFTVWAFGWAFPYLGEYA